MSALRQDGVESFVAFQLGKGISDHYQGESLPQAIDAMLALEMLLEPEVGGEKLPSLGWGKAEALYAASVGNTPNSVFPVFWWRYLCQMKERDTILHRAMEEPV